MGWPAGMFFKCIMFDNRDSIDFANQPTARLFRRMFVPTLISMVSMVVLNVTDGAFVGHGVGSDALAAVNIVAPLFLLMNGIGLLFGIGSSVVASIHFAQNNDKAANINLTQGVLAATLFGLLMGIGIYLFQVPVCYLFGCSDQLLPLACSYMQWMALLAPFNLLGMAAMFMVRLDGAPKVAMVVNCSMAFLNIVLDYVFIFPMHMGLEGAAMATAISFSLGCIPTVGYLLKFHQRVHFYRLKSSVTSLRLTARNLWYQARIGASALLGDGAIAAVMIVGNYVFMDYLGEDGVAAYSVACYCLPIVFMMGNAIVQSVQPILSFAHGAGNLPRLHEAQRIAVRTAALTGVLGAATLALASGVIAGTFMEQGCRAYTLCREGLPLLSGAFLFVALNIVLIGILQSTERSTASTLFTLLRGFILSIPSFLLLPMYLGVPGLWLALPVAEGVTLVVLVFYFWKQRL